MVGPGFEILLERAGCLVVNKPGGLLTQAPPGIDSLEARIKRFLASRENKPVYLGVPHRLDRHVSGAMVFATRRRAARSISQQFEGRLVQKTYWAVVEGAVTAEQGTWTDFLKKVPDEARVIVASSEDHEARQAILHFTKLGNWEDQTVLEIRLETGRMHQIRVQCATHGHTIIGDHHYGSTRPFGPQTKDQRLRWIALHAQKLGFMLPKSDELIEVAAPIPACWEQLQLPIG